ncbi:MAG: DNA repair protein RadA/Sms, partial [Kangiellaceae bacterium]
MAKSSKTQFVCTDCGHNTLRWQGQCICGSWNTMQEMRISAESSSSRTKPSKSNGVMGYAGAQGSGAKKINDVESTDAEKSLTGIGELDRVLSGGVTKGSVNIISGDPGAGKT